MKSQDVGHCEVCIGKSVRIMQVKKLREALLAFINGSDVFVSLSTSYGNPIIYEILPLVYDTLKSKKSVEVPCSLFIFTLNVPSERIASQNQQFAVVISYTVHIMLGHVFL